MKVYTKKGDDGTTSLYGGTRVNKDHLRIEAYGTVDELNSVIGIVMSYLDNKAEIDFWQGVQSRLFDIGAILATDGRKKGLFLPEIKEVHIEEMEKMIDGIEENLEPLKYFILPSGHISVAQCHVARTVCRRAERAVVRLSHEDTVSDVVVKYLNRLSDLLFVMSREFGRRFDVVELKWIP
ncbi:MAG TPA: cob(I)yrinic acid a,c-diamide adenosyltransferase [Chitinophagales bacterium]|nr:cob(I)yrinic acid a,c-diamide adenosyltransferase [Chitinophagales bacterium]